MNMRIIPLVALALAATVSVAQGAELSPEKREAIRELMSGAQPYYTETEAEAFADAYGMEAVPLLVEMLSDSSIDLDSRTKIAFFLGKFEDACVVDPIISFLESVRGDGLTGNEDAVMQLSLVGLGFTKSPAALDYLERATGLVFWKDVTITPKEDTEFTSVEKAKQSLRIYAMQGLEVAGEEGLKRLRSLEGVDDVPTWNDKPARDVSIAGAERRLHPQPSDLDTSLIPIR